MSYTELIKETLNILDLNVIFEENCLRKEKINGQIKTTFPTVLHFDDWKLLQKNQEKLDSLNRRRRPSFKTYLTETELVDRLLSCSVELTQRYTLYQDFLYAVHKRNQTYFDALNYPYSNGQLECLNNHIKVLKRNAYGFRNFYNFKLRIFVQQGQAIQTK